MAGKRGAEVVKQQGKPRYGICFAPSNYVDCGPAKLFGWWAEMRIMKHYLDKTSAAPFVTDWFDVQVPIPGVREQSPLTGPVAFFGFLSRFRPELVAQGNAWNEEFAAGRTAVPDILTAKPTRRDYYEIKPGSDSGRAAGQEKMGRLGKLMSDARFGLQAFRPGTFYNPGLTDDIDISDSVPKALANLARRLGIKKIKVVLSFRNSKENPGLVLYWICIDLESEDDLEEEAVENVARSFTLHTLRNIKRDLRQDDAAATGKIEVKLDRSELQRFIPTAEALRAAMISAGPAKEYAIVGGLVVQAFLDELEKVENEASRTEREQGAKAIENFKKMVQTGVPGLPQLYRRPSEINQSSYNYARAVAVTDAAIGVAFACAIAAPLVLPWVIGGAGAASGAAVLAPRVPMVPVPPVAAPAAADTFVVVTQRVAQQAGPRVVQQVAQRAAQALAESPESVKYAEAAGVLLIVGAGLVANPGSATAATPPAPQVKVIDTLRLVPIDDVPNFTQVGAGGSLTLPNGKRGIRMGRVTVDGPDELLLKLDPKRPPA